LLLLVLVTLAGCTSGRVGGEPKRSGPTASGPVDLRRPLELCGVVEPAQATATPSPSGTRLPDPDGGTLTLDPPFLTVERLAAAKIQFQEYDGHWAVQLTLTEDDARTFGAWTSAHVGERAAVVSNERVIFAPTIQDAIPGGELVISGQYDQEEAGDLLALITGR
jgi:preprotein translocase subunit SecD